MVSSSVSTVLRWCPSCVAVRYPQARKATFAAVRAALNAASNRRSSEIASTLASWRSRLTIPSKSAISSGLVDSALSQPYSAHFSKLIQVSYENHLFGAHNRSQKVIAAFELRFELVSRIDRRVDRTPNRAFDCRQLRDDFIERHIPNNHQIDVAVSVLFPPRHRSINKSQGDSLCQRRKSRAEHLKHANGLRNQRMHLSEHWMVAVCLVVDLSARHRPADQAELSEGLQLPLHGSDTCADMPRNLAHEERLIGMAVEKRQNAPPGLSEKQIAQRANGRTHNENKCTHYEYKVNSKHDSARRLIPDL